MNRSDRLHVHQVNGTWMPNPEGHLQSIRDGQHFYWTLAQLQDLPGAQILDVGCYDGWLDFLLIRKGFKPHGVELILELAQSACAYAHANQLDYLVMQGFFDEMPAFSTRYDVAICYEVLEHVPLDLVPVYVGKMEGSATKRILISLPDQKHEDNPQHLWTPTEALAREMWGARKGFSITRQDYPGTDIPANFFIRWEL